MPRITINGIHPFRFSKRRRIEQMLREAFVGAVYANDIVFECVSSRVFDVYGRSAPYLGVHDTEPSRAQDVARRLRPFQCNPWRFSIEVAAPLSRYLEPL